MCEGKKIIHIHIHMHTHYILNPLLKKIQKQVFSQGKPVTGLGHILAGRFLISEIPFVSQPAFEWYGAEP